MPRAPKRRAYDATARREAAERTVRSILDAARTSFIERGYAATTMPAIAERAGIALDTVYAAVGKKPTLFRQLVEGAISGSIDPVPAEERDYVRRIRAEPRAAGKLRLYAAALGRIHARLAPLLRVLQAAAPLDEQLSALWKEISDRRAVNMRALAEDLLATTELRSGLTVQEVADIVWSMGSTEFFLLLVGERGWSVQSFEEWLGGAWATLLLDVPPITSVS